MYCNDVLLRETLFFVTIRNLSLCSHLLFTEHELLEVRALVLGIVQLQERIAIVLLLSSIFAKAIRLISSYKFYWIEINFSFSGIPLKDTEEQEVSAVPLLLK